MTLTATMRADLDLIIRSIERAIEPPARPMQAIEFLEELQAALQDIIDAYIDEDDEDDDEASDR